MATSDRVLLVRKWAFPGLTNEEEVAGSFYKQPPISGGESLQALMTDYPGHKQPGRVAFLSPRLNGIALIIAHKLSRRFLTT